MSCLKVQKLISPFLDQRLAGEMRDDVLAHLAACRECAAYADSLDQTRHVLRALPERPVPERLAGALRVLASHEYQRRLYGGALHATLRAWRERFQLMTDNLMRPLALPFAGGLLSALVLFCMLVPTLGFQHNFRDDVPIASGYTNPSLQEISPFCSGVGAMREGISRTTACRKAA
jgi:anti-sigma factor RsiW